MDPGSAISGTQVYNGDRFAAAIFGFGGDAFDQRMGAQEFGEAATQCTRSVTVDDSNAGAMRKRGVVEEFVDEFGGLLDGHADDVDFPGCAAGSFRGALYRDASRRRASSVSCGSCAAR
jgi:hypothetical protein